MLENFKRMRSEGSVVSMLIKQGKYVCRLSDYMIDIPFVDVVHKYEIIKLVETCQMFKHIVFDVLFIKGDYYNGRVDQNIVNKFENLKIENLEDCRDAGKYLCEIGKSLKEHMNFLFAPFISKPVYISYLDFFIVLFTSLVFYVASGIL
jgi:hypothetical protein